MKHQNFPIADFEFINEPATDEQKQLITDLCEKRGTPIDIHGQWPNPFSKWDAGNMIEILKESIEEQNKHSK